MFLGWTGVGVFLLLAPVRAGNLIHDSQLFPEVCRGDRMKKIVLRAAGIALLGFAVHSARGVVRLVGLKGKQKPLAIEKALTPFGLQVCNRIRLQHFVQA